MTNELPQGSYPEAFYRVSLKAIVRNSHGEILCVKENGSDWTLPGGGIDHGETAEQALRRELYEEVLIDEPFTFAPIGIDHMFVSKKDAWLLWVLYQVTFDGEPTFGIGPDGDAAEWRDPREFKDSSQLAQQLIYKWCVDMTYPIRHF